VVTVHDVAWRRHPETATARGARWHESALCRARDSGAALVVTSKLVAADLIGRILPTEVELKLGVVTALFGAPIFALIAWRAARSWRG